jgi:uncharacterized membrane protein YhhN
MEEIMKISSIVILFAITLIHVFTVKSKDQSDPEHWMRLTANITKPLLLPAICLFYLVFAQSYKSLLLFALVFGWLGDIALMFESRSSNNTAFMSGLILFLIGHIFYCILFFQQSSPLLQNNILFIVLYLPYLVYCLVLFSYLLSDQTPGVVKVGVIIYSIVLTLMSFAGLTLLIYSPTLNSIFIFLGSLLFISSDSVLALKGIKGEKHLPEQYVLGSYVMAQLFIVIGNI